MKRRGFLASLIGAAVAPSMFLASMPAEARALISPAAWTDGGILRGAGRLVSINLHCFVADALLADFSVFRHDGMKLMQFQIHGQGGSCIWSPRAGEEPIFTEKWPMLVKAHEQLEGALFWQPAGKDIVSIPIVGGRLKP